MEISREMIIEAVEGVRKTVPREYVKKCSRSHEFPQQLWDAVARQGLLGLGVPEELGGSGGGLTELVTLQEEMNRAGIGLQWLVIVGMVRSTLIKYGNESQKQKYVAPTATGDAKLCFAITEPNAGTNTFKIESLARRTPEGNYLLNGQKTFISGFDEADYCLLVARTTSHKEVTDRRQGISLFMLDTKAKGISMTPLDIRADISERQWTLYFDDVELPAENLVGEEGKGIKYLFSALNPERLIVAALNLGIGEYVLARAIEYARERAPFDQPIGSYQSLQHPLAYARAHLDAARLMTYKACELFDAGQECGREANTAKLLASDAGWEATNTAMQVFGGSSLDDTTDIVGFLSLMRLQTIAPISNQMILNYIGEHVLGLPRSY